MNIYSLVLRNLRYYRQRQLGVLLGAAIATAILVGALVIGDSVSYSLQRLTLLRLGETGFAMQTEDRLFYSDLADSVASFLQAKTAPLLHVRGLAVTGGGKNRVNEVQIYGVDRRFWSLGDTENLTDSPSIDTVVINQRLAKKLELSIGDECLIRIENIELLPRDAPLSTDEVYSRALRVTIGDIAADDRFGRFGLETNQVSPFTVFVPLSALAAELEVVDRANVLLVSFAEGKIDLPDVEQAVRRCWRLKDSGLELTDLYGFQQIELKSDRVFLDPPVVHASFEVDSNATGIFTYFVNRIRSRNKTTPYSFVSAPGPPLVPADMSDDEIIVSAWLADDLGVHPGDSVEMEYFILGPKRSLVEESASFTVRSVVPLDGRAADRNLMPRFPGLTGAASCSDWDPGIPIDLDLLRDKDERYWEEYGGTPKAFITLSSAQRLWQNRYGDLTSIRFSVKYRNQLAHKLQVTIDPTSLGMIIAPVRQEGLAAGSHAVDFGQLFLGLSFFIVVAAGILTALLFVFIVENRARETGLLLAVGFYPSQVRRLILTEGIILALFGTVFGVFLGIVYNRALIYGLDTLWQGAVGETTLVLSIRFSTLFVGAISGFVTAAVALLLAIRKSILKPIHVLQESSGRDYAQKWRQKRRNALFLSIITFIVALFLLIFTLPGRGREATGVFFAAGSLVLFSCITFFYQLLLFWSFTGIRFRAGMLTLGIRNAARNRKRSLATIALMAAGIFVVVAVGANRHGSLREGQARSSGTGGFSLYAQTTIPVFEDLNKASGRNRYGIPELDTSVEIVQMRLKEGDDASCLNLNQVQKPKILGVPVTEFSRREAFTFVKTTADIDTGDPWTALERDLPDSLVPGIADQTVITWGLGKAVGDTLLYTDERGQPLKIILIAGLANSVFQGHVLISEKAFTEHFPSLSGYRIFLLDVAPGQADETARLLSWALLDNGVEMMPAAERLAAFNQVENTYLSIFLILGGLGLLLGSVGLGIVVMRNVHERRGEFALLRAVGFSRRQLHELVLVEHLFLLIAGLVSGFVSAFLAVLPAITSPDAEIEIGSLLLIGSVIFANGLIWTAVAASAALRGELLPNLRGE